MLSHRLLVPLGTAAFVAAVPGLASAAATWSTSGSGVTAAKAGLITAPTTVTVPGSTVTNGTVAVSWSGATGPSGATLLYFVERMAGTTPTAVCSSTFASSIPATSCSDSSVPDGTYQYRVTTRLGGNWRAVSSQSSSVTLLLAPPNAPTGLSATIQGGAKFTPSWTAPSSGTTPTGYECQVRSPQGTAANTTAPSGVSGSINTWFTCSSGVQVNTSNATYTLYVRGMAGASGATKGTPSAGLNIDP